MRKTWSVPKMFRENGCPDAFVKVRKFLRCRMVQTKTWLLVSFAVLLLGLSGAANATRPTVISTDPATGVTGTGATLNGTINPQNRRTTVTFNYGLTVAYGSTVTATQSPVAANSGNTAVSAPLAGLACNTTYHYQVAARNSSGNANPQGGDVTFTTLACVTSINLTSASPTNAASVQWTVTFGQSETGVSASNFTLVNTGLGGSPAITAVSGSGTTWTVTASTGTGSGSLGLNATSTAGLSPAVAGLPFTGQVYSIDRVAPTVSSINTANPNPTTAASVSWTVTFSKSVTGVSASNFSLAITGLGGPPAITSVSGSGTTWTVTASTGSGTGSLGLNQTSSTGVTDVAGNALTGTFTGQVYTVQGFCSPPPNIPAGVTVSCVCDTFGRASLNPSPIFGGNWSVSNSEGPGGTNPYINPGTGLLRLTENTANNAKAATVPSIFPAAGNYISVEFLHYAYNGTNPGADGIAVTLSDSTVPAVPGGFGGSLGYAQRNDGVLPPGFAGGWVGVALDEWGNYQNPTEGRVGGPGFTPESVGVRGPGNGANGYRWMGGTASNPGGLSIDNPASATPAPGYMYQVIVDARNFGTGTVNVSVNQDSTTMNGANYVSLFGPFNAYTEANFAVTQGWIPKVVPDYWKISFTGSTGGANNIHEIGGLRICAQSVFPPTGGTASGFSAIDDAYPAAPGNTVPAYPNFQTGHIYMKLIGTPFNLWVAALTGTGISTGYSAISTKYVAVKLVDNSDNVCGPDSARTCNSACTNKPVVEAGATQIATFASGGTTGVASPSPTFTLNSAWKNLLAVMNECTDSSCTAFTATTPACSADSFSVRPTSIASVTSSNATYGGTTSSTPIVAAGNPFSLTATTTGIGTNPGGYTGIPKINSVSIQAVPLAANPGALAGTFAAAISGTGNSTATGASFTYNEVGAFLLRGPDFTVPRIPGVYDDNWTAIDSDPLKNDCNSGTTAAAYSNTKDANGKYGCNFGITADTVGFGRFTPAYFDVTKADGCIGSGMGSSPVAFTYSGQTFAQVQMTAKAVGGSVTKNYNGILGFAKAVQLSDGNGSTAGVFGNGTFAAAAFANGTQTQTNVSYTFTITKETPPLTLKLRATEAAPGGDGVTSASGGAEASATIRSGRIHLQNAYGSELADLPMPQRVEYYSGASDGWVANDSDTCSAVGLKAFTNPQGNMTVGKTCVQDTGNPGVSGQGCAIAGPAGEQYLASPSLTPPPSVGSYNLYLKAPGAGNQGSLDVTANLATTMPWLQYDWNGTGTEIEPKGRATFGQYRGSPRSIYLRERY